MLSVVLRLIIGVKMGLQIGQVSGALSSLRESSDFGRARVEQQPGALSRSGFQRDGVGPFFEAKPPKPQVGVGSGLSTPGAALKTIDRTVAEVRKRTPSMEEIRERFRISSAEQRDRVLQANLERPVRKPFQPAVERRIPEPAAQARNFITDVDDSHVDIETQFGNREPEVAPLGPSETPGLDASGLETPVREVPVREAPDREVPNREVSDREGPAPEGPAERPRIDVKV